MYVSKVVDLIPRIPNRPWSSVSGEAPAAGRWGNWPRSLRDHGRAASGVDLGRGRTKLWYMLLKVNFKVLHKANALSELSIGESAIVLCMLTFIAAAVVQSHKKVLFACYVLRLLDQVISIFTRYSRRNILFPSKYKTQKTNK